MSPKILMALICSVDKSFVYTTKYILAAAPKFLFLLFCFSLFFSRGNIYLLEQTILFTQNTPENKCYN